MKFKIISIFAIFATIICISCSNSSNSEDKERIAQLEAQINELKSNGSSYQGNENKTNNSYNSKKRDNYSSRSNKESNNFAGIYVVTDDMGNKWTINLKDDESVTVKDASGKIYYGSWSSFPYDVPCLSFGWDEWPYLYFPAGEENIDHSIIDNDQFYSSNTNYKAKNPNQRLPIKKIK